MLGGLEKNKKTFIEKIVATFSKIKDISTFKRRLNRILGKIFQGDINFL